MSDLSPLKPFDKLQLYFVVLLNLEFSEAMEKMYIKTT